MRTARVAILVSFAMAAVTSCSHKPPAEHSPGPSILQQTQPDQRAVSQAMQELIRRCMLKKGYNYPPPTSVSTGDSVTTTVTTTWTQWGFDDVPSARSKGYGFYAERTASPPSSSGDPIGDYYKTLSKSQQKAFDLALWGSDDNRVLVTMPDGNRLGIATDGCSAEVRDQVYPNRSSFMTLSWFVENSGSAVDQRIAASSDYVAAVTKWKACMNGQGYPYTQVGDGRAEAESNYSTMPLKAARAAEIRIATADAECGRSSGVVRVSQALEVKLQGPFEQQNESKLLAWEAMEKQALTRVKALLANNQ